MPPSRHPPGPLPASRREGGFTLLEVLVAFVIAALALGVLFRGAVEGLGSVQVADRLQEALTRAQSHLAVVGHGLVPRPLTQEGDDGSGFHWQLRIAPIGSEAVVAANSDASSAATVTLYEATVTESWSESRGAEDTDEHRRSIHLSTEVLGTRAGAGS